MDIVFIGEGLETTHDIYDPKTGRKFHFKDNGVIYSDVPDKIAIGLISNFPRRFGKSKEAIMNVRGLKMIKVEKSKEPEKKTKETIEHPFVKNMKKVEKAVKGGKTGGKK